MDVGQSNTTEVRRRKNYQGVNQQGERASSVRAYLVRGKIWHDPRDFVSPLRCVHEVAFGGFVKSLQGQPEIYAQCRPGARKIFVKSHPTPDRSSRS